MSNDLISRKALSENICNAECKIPKFESDRELNAFLLGLNAKQIVVMECLSSQPTAYDPDKVVKKLELCQLSNNGKYKHLNMPIVKAIEIVRGGAVE